jgi:isovaleryl-CoA dehydrogenase
VRATPDLDFGLDENALMMREAAVALPMNRSPLAAAIDAEDRFLRELWVPMGELGLHGVTVEEE